MGNLLAMMSTKDRNWAQTLPYALFAYRVAPHCSSGVSPYFALFGHDARLPTDLVLEQPFRPTGEDYLANVCRQFRTNWSLMREQLEAAQRTQAFQHDKGLSLKRPLKVGDLVLLKRHTTPTGTIPKLADKYSGPFRVIDTRGPRSLIVGLHNAVTTWQSNSNLKRYLALAMPPAQVTVVEEQNPVLPQAGPPGKEAVPSAHSYNLRPRESRLKMMRSTSAASPGVDTPTLDDDTVSRTDMKKELTTLRLSILAAEASIHRWASRAKMIRIAMTRGIALRKDPTTQSDIPHPPMTVSRLSPIRLSVGARPGTSGAPETRPTQNRKSGRRTDDIESVAEQQGLVPQTPQMDLLEEELGIPPAPPDAPGAPRTDLSPPPQPAPTVRVLRKQVFQSKLVHDLVKSQWTQDLSHSVAHNADHILIKETISHGHLPMRSLCELRSESEQLLARRLDTAAEVQKLTETQDKQLMQLLRAVDQHLACCPSAKVTPED
jgi:hypothetical protein